MKIDFTKQEYQALVEMLLIADWVQYGHECQAGRRDRALHRDARGQRGQINRQFARRAELTLGVEGSSGSHLAPTGAGTHLHEPPRLRALGAWSH